MHGTDFKFKSKPPEFKLGINGMGLPAIPRDLTPFHTQTIPNKPLVMPKPPQPNIFFTPIQDNREQVLGQIKKDLEYQLEFRRTTLPGRY